jgi:hypothetical protein
MCLSCRVSCLHEFCLMYRLEVDEEKEVADGIRIDMGGLS